MWWSWAIALSYFTSGELETLAGGLSHSRGLKTLLDWPQVLVIALRWGSKMPPNCYINQLQDKPRGLRFDASLFRLCSDRTASKRGKKDNENEVCQFALSRLARLC